MLQQTTPHLPTLVRKGAVGIITTLIYEYNDSDKHQSELSLTVIGITYYSRGGKFESSKFLY